MAIVGEASIRGVPALGLPKMSNLVGRMVIPTIAKYIAVMRVRRQGKNKEHGCG